MCPQLSLRTVALLAILLLQGCFKTHPAQQPAERDTPETTQQSADRDEPETKWPRTEELAVELEVLYAIEGGPFVCKVILKNVSNRTLNYATSILTHGASCRVEAGWKAKKEPLIRIGMICGPIGPFAHRLSPGESASHTFYLHQSFLEVPAGDVPLHFGWDVYRTRKSTAEEATGRSEKLERLFSLQRTQSVQVQPATKDNLTRVLHNLQDDFTRAATAVVGHKDYSWCSLDPADNFVQTLAGCRRKEYVPLLLRAADQLPASQYRRKLVETVYESSDTPEEGFAILANYLASPRPAAADEVFECWQQAESDHKDSARRQEKLRQGRKPTGAPEKDEIEPFYLDALTVTRAEEEAWRTSRRHLDVRLTEEQFRRLLAMEDVWVRALLCSYFADRCPPDWARSLLDDLRRATRPPERFRKLLAQLDDNDFQVRERATQELTDDRDAFVTYFGTAPEGRLSLEASRRLQRALEGVDTSQLPPLWRRTIDHLASSDRPQDRRMLDVLRTADPPNLIIRTAQAAFEERRKRDEAARH